MHPQQSFFAQPSSSPRRFLILYSAHVASLRGLPRGAANLNSGFGAGTVPFFWSKAMADFIDTTDDGMLSWGANFSTRITATPIVYGLTAAIATTLAGEQSAYASPLSAAQEPSTRGSSTVIAKNTVKADLIAYCRQLTRTIQGVSTLTAQQKHDLGITVRDTQPSPIPPPANAPSIITKSTIGNTVRI